MCTHARLCVRPNATACQEKPSRNYKWSTEREFKDDALLVLFLKHVGSSPVAFLPIRYEG
jgi:hypothetical protein